MDWRWGVGEGGGGGGAVPLLTPLKRNNGGAYVSNLVRAIYVYTVKKKNQSADYKF